MLSSQIATASQASISSLLLQSSSISTSTAILRSSGTLPRRSRSHHQIRTLRIGLWSSYLDPHLQKEIQRRQRIMKHKYMEALNRKLSWDRQGPMSPRHFGFKGFMCSAWRGHDPRPGGRWVDIDELSGSKGTPLKNSSGIEDVEQSALDKLLNSKDGLYDLVRTRSRILGNKFNSAIFMPANSTQNSTLTSSGASQNDNSSHQTYGQEGFRKRFQSQDNSNMDKDYEIDPITNRKVYKNKAAESPRKPIEVPVKTFKGYRSQFEYFAPPTSQPSLNTSKSPELKTLVTDVDKKLDTVKESSKTYKPFFENMRFGNKRDGEKPDLEQVVAKSPSVPPCPVQQGLRDYDSRTIYGPVLYREPDGKLPEKPDSTRECLKEYEFNGSYGPVMYREPDGKLAEKVDTVRESIAEYERSMKYGPVMYREPDGKLPEQPCPVRESLKDYDSRVKYGPVAHNVLDARDTVAEGLRDFDKRADYGPRRILKNIFLRQGNGKTDKSFRYPTDTDTREDLDLLRASDVRASSGIIKAEKKETEAEKSAVRKELEGDFGRQQNLETSRAEEVVTAPEMNAKRKPLDSVETPLSKVVEGLKIENSELRNINAHVRGRIDAKLAEVSEELSSKSPQRNMTGNFARDFPEEFEARWTSKNDSEPLTSQSKTSGNDIQTGFLPGEAYSRNQNTTRLQTSLDRQATGVSEKTRTDRLQAEIDPYSKEPQGLETSYIEEVKLQNEKDPYSKKAMGLETNYREELARERALEIERDPYSKVPRGLETSFAAEMAEQRALELERDPYSKVPQGLETSYKEEVKLQNEIDPYSKKPIGLETSFAEEVAAKQGEGDLSVHVSSYGNGKPEDSEKSQNSKKEPKAAKKKLMKKLDQDLVREVRGIYEETYGSIDTKHRQILETSDMNGPVSNTAVAQEVESASNLQEPTVYKILAYDPTMQSINTAETTSIVEDSASALTPAEVLLRLSNPAKFFPHFEPLQAQGYEIVSGSGDVLVFRKVRAAGPSGSKSESSSSIQDRTRQSTNPIDGMQSSPIAATGNFASPTGFVNHDLPMADPPFKSNIDVRREEPVFSGTQNWQDDSETSRRKKKGRGKRLLIGAAWVAGCSYAIGVVAEFFRTGGLDGRGPQGF